MRDHLISKLKGAIAAGDAVVVVGTGVSVATVPAAQRAWAGWPGLLSAGLDRCPDLTDAQRRHYRDMLANCPGLDELLDVASAVERRLKKHGLFFDWLTDTIGKLEVADPGLIKAIGALGRPILTTNYDGLLGKVLGLEAVTWKNSEAALAIARGQIPGILHLHGHGLDSDSIVLGDASYQSVVDNPGAKLLKEALAALKTIVFIGCGVDGVTDPDLGPILANYGALFKGAKHKHLWLCRDGDAGQALPDGILALPYGANYADLIPFLRQLTAPAVAVPAVTAPPAPRLPPKPAHFTGRTGECAELAAAVVAGQHALVMGAPGIGKSALCISALHEVPVQNYFGPRRWFADLDGVTDSDAMLARIGRAMGLPPEESGGPAVLFALEQRTRADSPTLLVLDNLETPYTEDQPGCRDILTRLKDLPGLTLLAGMRGHQRPEGVAWAIIKDLPRLSPPHDRALFLALAGDDVAGQPHLDDLLRELGGLPLAIRLMARQAQNCPLALLWPEWQQRRTKLLEMGIGKDDNLAVSIDLSLNCKAMTPPGRMLLSLLCHLPDGIAAADLRKVYDKGVTAAANVHQLALADWTADKTRLHQLAPIREYLTEALKSPPPKIMEPCLKHYLALAGEAGKAGRDNGADIVARISGDLGNLEAMVALGLNKSGSLRNSAIDAAWSLSEFSRFTGLCRPEELLQRAADVAERSGNWARQADCLRQLAATKIAKSQLADAERLLEKTMAITGRQGGKGSEGDNLRHLGRLCLQACDFAAAWKYIAAAKEVYHRQRAIDYEASCVMLLGNIHFLCSEIDAALEKYEAAASLSSQKLDAANISLHRAGIALLRGNLASARACHDEAEALYQAIGDSLGLANCHATRAKIDILNSDTHAARPALDDALPLHRRVGDLIGEVTCLNLLGMAARIDGDGAQAEQLARQALALTSPGILPRSHAFALLALAEALRMNRNHAARDTFAAVLATTPKTRDDLTAGESHRGLGDLAFTAGDIPTARAHWHDAIAAFQRLPAPHWIARVQVRLARAADNAAERQEWLGKARATWTAMGLDRRLAALDAEFGPA